MSDSPEAPTNLPLDLAAFFGDIGGYWEISIDDAEDCKPQWIPASPSRPASAPGQ